MLRFHPIVCTGHPILYVIFTGLSAFVNVLFPGKRTLKNIGDGPEDKIKELSDVLVQHRTAFLDRATISTQTTAFQILDDVAKISSQLSDAGK